MKRVSKIVLGRVLRWFVSVLRLAMPYMKRSYSVRRLVSDTFQAWYELPVSPTHYYSPLPDMPALKRNIQRWNREGSFVAVEMALDKQIALLRQLEAYRTEIDDLPNQEQVRAAGYGLGYGEVESPIYYAMVRDLKPRRIVEIGSGVSTYYAVMATETNSQERKTESSITCIEPFPLPKLIELAGKGKIILRQHEVQDIDIAVFKEMAEGDILFIDSSHVSKVDSDVNFLVFEALPSLKRGVVVHFHDMPFPCLTLQPDHWCFDLSLMWNEPALVKAFLMYNSAFEVLVCQSYLHYKCPEAIKRLVSIYDVRKHFPDALWLVKTS